MLFPASCLIFHLGIRTVYNIVVAASGIGTYPVVVFPAGNDSIVGIRSLFCVSDQCVAFLSGSAAENLIAVCIL